MKLDKWQQEALEYEGNLLLCTGRQVGKTTIMARKAAERALRQKACRILVVSLTEDQAKLIILMVLNYMEKNHKSEICKGKNKPTQNKICLKNNSSILARPVGTTGDAVRGFTGDVLIIDEASRMTELVWTAARPTLLTTAGEIWICSTPFGKQGYFWEAFQNKDGRYKVIHVSSEEVIRNREINEDWTEKQRTAAIKFLENEKKDMSALQYGQEYLGLFLDDLQRYFSDELIKKACIETRPTTTYGNMLFMGVDIARMGEDKGTYEILKRDGRRIIQVENIITEKKLTTETEDIIIELDKTYCFEKIGIDAGAGTLGVSIFDHLLRTDLRNKIVAINNAVRFLDREEKQKTKILKEDLYDNLRSLMERGELTLLDDESVKLSLCSVQWAFEKDDFGNTKLKIFGNDTHIVEGLIRAAYLAKEKNLNLWVRTIKI